MSSLSNVEAKLPRGFRFHPKDEELIYDYLIKWIMGCPLKIPLLIEVDLNKCEPWDIPKTACVGGKEWYFFSQKDKKYSTGLRTNRATASGYWKATGKDRPIVKSGALIGMRKTLVFYLGRAPKGSKTDWVMHEFRVEGPELSSNHVKDQDWVLCRVFCKNIQQSSPPSSDQRTHSKQENPNPNLDFVSTPSSSSRPSLTELPNHYNVGFEQHDNNVANYHHAQVPCFSTHTTPNQTSPYHNFSLNMNPTRETLSNFGDHPDDHHLSSCDGEGDGDKKVIAEVLNHLTRKDLILDNKYRYGNISIIKSSMSCSPSFVDQSSECFLSELGFSSVWNQYS